MKGRSLSLALFFTAHAVSATAAAFLLSWIFGGLSPTIAGVSLVYSFFRAKRFVRSLKNTLEWRAPEAERNWSAPELAISIFVLFAAWKHFAWMMPVMPGANGGAITTLSATNFGDLPLHINFIRFLSSGVDFIPLNPIFSSEPLRYPFGPDLYNAIWECLGFTTSGHLFVVGLAATFATLALLRELGGAWGMAAFFLAGGSAVAEGAQAVDWKSFFLAIWVTQRGMLFALPIGLTLLLYLRPHLSGDVRLSRRAVRGLGRMWAVFPLFHAHSFVVVSLLLFALIWRDFGLLRTRDFFKRFFTQNRALAWALIPASLLIHHTSAGFTKASVVRWRLGWLSPEEGGLAAVGAWFLTNFGAALGTLVALGFVLILVEKYWSEPASEKGRSIFSEVGVLVLFFAFFLCLMLAPWEWDNIKVLIWPWILVFSVLGRRFLRLYRLKPHSFWPLVTWLGVISAFSGGTLVLAQSWNRPQDKSVTIWTLEQLAPCEEVLVRISRHAVFAAATSPNHVLSYFGRARALGYPGHLWSHAIDYRTSEENLDRLMAGTEGWVEAAKKLKITHIYWGPEERLRWNTATPEWRAKLPLVAKSGDHEVYEFKETR